MFHKLNLGENMIKTLELEINEINYIYGALGKCPAEEVEVLRAKIKDQIKAQEPKDDKEGV